ncbi:uncharacterized protein LOC127702564 [Mytilus californianus]|uniref:uncharacterized protein LOC127702564 n=1 Tax=Mytilus californianus TaxID=6549 RepID=UPI0022471E54|nr:uncharacterized protein LOC127702564 [Mytilus californianus]
MDEPENRSVFGDQQQSNSGQGQPVGSVMSKKRKTYVSFSQTLCDICAEIPVCTMCTNCRKIYCKICSDVHTESEKDHHIIHIPHVAGNQEEIICGKCVKNKAEQLCTTCLNLMCESCAESQIHTSCKGTKMLIIYQGHPKLQRQKSEEKLNYFQDLSIKKREEPYPIRICGMSYIADGRLVLVDKNNRNLLVFKSKEEKIRTYLEEEPHALTSMTGQHIAITFPFQMEIRIYKISENSIGKLNRIGLPSFGLYNSKPYSIAFDNDFFVVEVGEGDDGKIIIMNDKQIHNEIHNKNFAYFTGNTIRLALEVKNHNPLEGRVFLSALSKNVVFCVDFQGKEVWKVSIPSPRGISIVQEDCTPGNNLVICSRRCNALFGLNKDNGRDKQILLSGGKINLPRFISYNNKNRLLCIQVTKGDDEDESVSFIEVRPQLSIKPTKTI